MKCDRPLHGDDLVQWDTDESLIDFALERAGLGTLLDVEQEWIVGDAELTVSKWWVEDTDRFALRVWSGWAVPGRLRKPSPGALDPAWLYAIAISGALFYPSFTERAKYKLRLLLDAGLVQHRRGSILPPLPADAKESESIVWGAVGDLLRVERICDCHAPGSDVMLTPAFVARWGATTFDIARDGLRRLRRRGYLVCTGAAETSAYPQRQALLFRIEGDG